MNDYYYQLRNCSDPQDIFYTDTDLIALGMVLGSIFQTVEFPGVCWEIIQIVSTDDYNGPVVSVTHVGPIFTECPDCLANVIQGCTDPTACNFDPCATIDDGSCFYNNVTIRILCNDPITTCDINANCN